MSKFIAEYVRFDNRDITFHNGLKKQIRVTVMLDLISNGDCSFLLDDNGRVDHDKLMSYLNGKYLVK